jgi:ornithine cyclodeaminase/alanine dehydrogenase-like protein (mu-crystallin family)
MSDLRLISADQVRALLSVGDCIDVMERAMRAVSSGSVVMPQRLIAPVAGSHTVLGLMPSSEASLPVYAVKVLSLTPDNPARGYPAVQGLLIVFDALSHAPLAVIDGAEVTALRTAAVSGLATRTLARPDANTLGVFGTGRQLPLHIDAVRAVRPLRRVVLWGRDAAKTCAIAEREAQRTGLDIVAGTAAEVAACTVVCTITAASTPVLHGDWVQPGCHVNLVGTHTLQTREADGALMARARIVVDQHKALQHEGGNVHLAVAEGAISADAVLGELGEVLSDSVAGRQSAQDITVFVSHGIAAQDLYTAAALVQRAGLAAQ